MPHVADFTDAHRRHWEDAELLFGCSRWANADHLYGLSAECGLKAVMKVIGMYVDDQGAPIDKKYRKHIDELWLIYMDFAKHHGQRQYLLDGNKPFDDWSIHDRYASGSHFTQPNVGPHRYAACRIRDMVDRASTDL